MISVIGDSYVDLVFKPVTQLPPEGGEIIVDDYEIRAGGSAGYVAQTIAALGVDVKVATAIGDGYLSHFWRSTIESRGVNTGSTCSNEDSTIGTSVVLLDDTDRRFITHRGANETSELLLQQSGSVLMISGYSQTPALWSQEFVDFVEEQSENGVTVTLDTNWSPGNWQPYAEQLLPHIDYFLANDYEAVKITGASSIDEAISQLLSLGASSCIITQGENGCIISNQNTYSQIPAANADPVDYNAAGDIFNAAFITALSSDRSVENACEFAHQCAATGISVFPMEEKLSKIQIKPGNES